MAKSYDPGTVTCSYRTGKGTFAVPSWRGDTCAYLLDVSADTCTCPDYEHRQAKVAGRCKHLRQAHSERFAVLLATAAKLTENELLQLLPKYEAVDQAVAVAIRAELFDRGQTVAG